MEGRGMFSVGEYQRPVQLHPGYRATGNRRSQIRNRLRLIMFIQPESGMILSLPGGGVFALYDYNMMRNKAIPVSIAGNIQVEKQLDGEK